MSRANSFGQINTRVSRSNVAFPTVVAVAPATKPPPSKPPPSKPPPAAPLTAPPPLAEERPEEIVGEIVRPTAVHGDGGVSEGVECGRVCLRYPMQRVGDEVRMRAKMVDAVTGDAAWKWMTVYRESEGERERFVRFASA